VTVSKTGSKYKLVSKKGKTLGTHSSKAKARKQEAAIKASQKR
jgi:hypothetical protein